MADRIRSVAIAAIVLPVLFLAMSGFARAASIVVNTLDGGTESVPGPCSLTDAVAAANAGGTVKNCIAGSGANAITFSVTGTISTAALLDITDTQLTITGPAGGITIDGSSSHEIVKADTGTTVTLTNLTFAHGSTSGGGGAIDGDGTASRLTIAPSTTTTQVRLVGQSRRQPVPSQSRTALLPAMMALWRVAASVTPVPS